MSNTLSFPQELNTLTIIGLDTRLKMELTDKGKQVLAERYAKSWNVDGRNARHSVTSLYERGNEHVMTLRELISYFGPLYRPVDPLDMEEDDYIVASTLTLLPDVGITLLGER